MSKKLLNGTVHWPSAQVCGCVVINIKSSAMDTRRGGY